MLKNIFMISFIIKILIIINIKHCCLLFVSAECFRSETNKNIEPKEEEVVVVLVAAAAATTRNMMDDDHKIIQ